MKTAVLWKSHSLEIVTIRKDKKETLVPKLDMGKVE